MITYFVESACFEHITVLVLVQQFLKIILNHLIIPTPTLQRRVGHIVLLVSVRRNLRFHMLICLGVDKNPIDLGSLGQGNRRH